jgi:hypothetical protein
MYVCFMHTHTHTLIDIQIQVAGGGLLDMGLERAGVGDGFVRPPRVPVRAQPNG